ncbi:MAG: pilus assembly protein PilM [Candidatus Omnitrophota bacterium]
MLKINYLKDFFSKSPDSALGLDIGNLNVKLFKAGSLKNKVFSFAAVPIQPEGSTEKIIGAIKEAHRLLNADTNKVNISLCGSNVLVRYVVLPQMKDADIRKSLDFELEKYIPYKKEDTVIDFCVLKRLVNNKAMILLAASERRVIQDRVNLVREAGLEVDSINIDCLALFNTFKFIYPDFKGVVGLLDVGYKMTKLVVLDNGIPHFSRDIESGRYNVLQLLGNKMSLPINKAEEFEMGLLGNSPENIMEIVGSYIRHLVNELLLSFEYCERDLAKKVERVSLTGGGSNTKGLSVELQKILTIPVDFLDLNHTLKVAPSSGSRASLNNVANLAVSMGLAIA